MRHRSGGVLCAILLALSLQGIHAASTTSRTNTLLHFEQIHIALAGSHAETGVPTTMAVSWFTLNSSSAPAVRFGMQSGSLNARVEAETVTYLKGHGFHHHAVLSEPLPSGGKRVFYKVGDSAEDMWSQELSFLTAREPSQEFTMSIFGDMGFESSTTRPIVVPGEKKEWSATYTRMRLEALKNAGEIDYVWHLGDIAYADDAFLETPFAFKYEGVMNGWMNWMQNITSTMPYQVSVGNHESEDHSPYCLFHNKECAQPLSNFSAYNARWRMPSEESGGRANMWYSWNYGDAHFVSLNTETDFPGAGESKTGDSHIPWLKAGGFGRKGEYLDWLERDLAAADAARKSGDPSGRRWIIAGGHRPFGDIQECCADLLEKYGVDMYVAGHGHSYSRSMPATSSKVDDDHSQGRYTSPNGTVWIMVGGAGCDEMTQGNDTSAGVVAAPHGSTVVTSRRYATGVLTVNSTALYWRLVDSVNGAILDELTIV